MAQYVCSVCGYVYDEAGGEKWEALPADFKCPVCGAGKDAFYKKEDAPAEKAEELVAPEVQKELSAWEMSIICSNLARGCEKQYLDAEAENFRKLAEFFKTKAAPIDAADEEALLAMIEKDLAIGYPYANSAASQKPDRGALRSLVWSEKVTRMQQSLLSRYEAEGEKMLENTGVWLCTICGFISVSDAPPEICPVCKVPAWKFEKIEGREQ